MGVGLPGGEVQGGQGGVGQSAEGWRDPGRPPASLGAREGGRVRKKKGGKHSRVLSRGAGDVLIGSELCTHSHL